jgi:ADP-ribose pyrophosphatase
VPQTLELPGGFVPAGTTPEEGVGKELQEEIGMRAGKLATLGVVYPSPGVSNERDHTFLATQLTPSQRSSGEETERDLEVVTMPFGQAYDMFLSSKQPVAAQTLAAMAKAARLL